MIKGFEPIVYEEPKYLILGSLPSVKSLSQNEYYGHPQNRFWRVLSAVYTQDISTYDKKKKLLKERNIALWDVVCEADREGSSDSKITNVVPNDIENFLRSYPSIKMILCTGNLAYSLCVKYFGDLTIPIYKLPSPSPANASCSLSKLIEEYSKYLK